MCITSVHGSYSNLLTAMGKKLCVSLLVWASMSPTVSWASRVIPDVCGCSYEKISSSPVGAAVRSQQSPERSWWPDFFSYL